MSCLNPFCSCIRHGQRQTSTGNYGYNLTLNSATALLSEDADLVGSSMIEPELDEAGDWTAIEFDDSQWTDSELMEDGRPGRRRAVDDQEVKPHNPEKPFKGTSLVTLLRRSRVDDDTGCGRKSKGKCVKEDIQGQRQRSDEDEDVVLVEGRN